MKTKFILIPFIIFFFLLSIKDSYNIETVNDKLSFSEIAVDTTCVRTYHRNNLNKLIPDNATSNPIFDTIDVGNLSGKFVISVKVTIDTVYHTWIGDLKFWLTIDNISDTIISRPGWIGSGFGNSCDNFIGTRLLDSFGIISVQNITPSTCPTGGLANSTGSFLPKSPLSVFRNSVANGKWILRISDNASADSGKLVAWSLTIQYCIIDEIHNNAFPVSYHLEQYFPNPFNPKKIINYERPTSNFVSLKVYDVLGNEVATLVNEKKIGGKYSVVFNGENLPSGVYYYKIESGDFTDTKKMLLIK